MWYIISKFNLIPGKVNHISLSLNTTLTSTIQSYTNIYVSNILRYFRFQIFRLTKTKRVYLTFGTYIREACGNNFVLFWHHMALHRRFRNLHVYKKWNFPRALRIIPRGHILITRITFNGRMDKWSHLLLDLGWNHLSSFKLQRCNR